jgi:hypothetical protein
MTRETVAWLTPALAAMSASLVATVGAPIQMTASSIVPQGGYKAFILMKETARVAKELQWVYTFKCLRWWIPCRQQLWRCTWIEDQGGDFAW